MLQCTAHAWGFFFTCQLTCHNVSMWFDTYPLSLRSQLRNPWWCWSTWLAISQHTSTSACLWNWKVCILVFSNSMRTRSRWWKLSAMLTGQQTEKQDALSRDLQSTLVVVWLTQAPGRRKSCHFRAQSQKHMQLRRQLDAILITTIFSWLLRCQFIMWLYLDSSAARGVLSRKGVGLVRHLSCRILWVQDLVMQKRLLVRSVVGALNPADVATKRLSAARLESLCYFLGIWRGNNLEGATDPGNIFRHVTNQRQQGYSQAQVNLLINALSVLTQLQGCSGAMDAVTHGGNFIVVFLITWLLGLAGYIYLAIRPGEPLKSLILCPLIQLQATALEMTLATTVPRLQKPHLIAQHGLKRAWYIGCTIDAREDLRRQ